MFQYISINSGIGSLDLALQYLHSWRVACYVEKNPVCLTTLEYRIGEDALQNAPIWDDYSTFDGRPWHRLVDCIAGVERQEGPGDYSQCATTSSNKLISLVKEVEPSYILWQLSPSYKAKVLASADYLANGLEIFGYRSTIFKVRAGDMGADHRRTRIFVCAEMENASPTDKQERIREITHRMSTPCRATRWTASGRVCRGTNGRARRMEQLELLGHDTVPAMVAAVSTFLDSGIVF
jgi:site-specific DNA-cytosine methylase